MQQEWQSYTPLTCSPLQPPQKGYLRQRSPLRFKLLPRNVQPARYQAEHFNGLPPTDRWPKRTNQSISGAIPTIILRNTSKGLGSMATASPVYPELLA